MAQCIPDIFSNANSNKEGRRHSGVILLLCAFVMFWRVCGGDSASFKSSVSLRILHRGSEAGAALLDSQTRNAEEPVA